MKLTELAIKRPSAMSMIIMFFVVMGMFGYSKIGSDLFPKADIPVVTIISVYPGAGAEEMENQVVDEIEEAVSSLSGLKDTRSWVSEGVATTVMEFTMATDVDIASMDAQKAVDRVMMNLPKDMEKPIVQKVNLNADPVLILAVSGERPINEIYDIANNTVKERLQTVPGVAAINIVGGKKQQVRVEIDRVKLESYGLSVNQIVSLLKAENLNLPSGNIEGETMRHDVRLVGEFQTLADMERLPVPLPTGATVPLREIASIKNSFAEVNEYSRLNNNQAVGLIIQKQSDASIVDTVEGVRQELDSIMAVLPQDINIIVADDNSTFTKNSLADTQRTLLEGVIMTGLVLLFFLREWRSLVIVMLAIPTSIIATFMMMYFFDYTFNILSLMGLSLCVGILVDDSIVVLENIHRHLKMGKDPETAAIEGRSEIGMAAIAITLSDVVVFGPIAFMQGMVGQLFKQFGLTVVVATLFSLFVSFTLTPMMAAKFYKYIPGGYKKKNRLWEWIGSKSGSLGELIIVFYRKILIWALNNRLKVLAVVLLGVIASLSLIPLIGFEFITKADQSKFKITVEMPPGTTLNVTDKVVRNLEHRLEKIPEVSHTFSTVGGGTSNTSFIGGVSSPHLASIQVILKPKNERDKTVWEVADIARGWDDYPGVKMKILEAQMAGLNYMEAPIIVEIRGSDMIVLTDLAKKVKGIVEKTPGTDDVYMSWEENAQPEYKVVIDRDKASAMFLTTAEVAQAMRAAMNGEEASTITLDNKELDIWVQLSDINRKNPEDIGNISVSNRFGQTYLIKQLADIIPSNGPTEIRHKNRTRMISVLANYKGESLSTIVSNIETEVAKLNIPNGYEIGYDGEIKQMNDSNVDLAQALALSLVLVYMILVILYESFLTPFIRMLSLPCGIIGAMLALLLTGNTLNILSIIGLIMLEGLAAKNGTLLIDYTNTLMDRGANLRDALLEAGTARLRPIFMTSTTMIFGMLPTALALAAGSEIRRGMGIVLVGGLFTSTILTPILIPVAYTLLDDLKHWMMGKIKKRSQDKAAISG
ncbi:efflux RND transporter permease subunit [Phosphitispora sp. TUW77]|uniref:efflux RND transporter permease subunit n=1 Tax=Phosphitispora sp. TUW77 TaxID=3152361 RepID=UPI003AB317E5